MRPTAVLWIVRVIRCGLHGRAGRDCMAQDAEHTDCISWQVRDLQGALA